MYKFNLKLAIQLLKNMGLRYVVFRLVRFAMIKTGLFGKKFPVNPPSISIISVQEWKTNLPPFFFCGKNIVGLERKKSENLKGLFNDLESGTFIFFGKSKYQLGQNYDWVTNPITNYKYDIKKHWSLISDFSLENGDIKFVWEKARFSYLTDIIRYDYHYKEDCAGIVFREITSFIELNPINLGPNYICSQEISLRIFNWTLALYYYKDSELLTDELFRKIMNSIYWQIHHVYKNINFSKIAVRNNHAIAETLLLYSSYLLFPFFPKSEEWSKKGKKWFENEIVYQIYNDGTYLQFSNNYHRVVVQLMTWGICLSKLNNKMLIPEVSNRALKSLEFLYQSMDMYEGMLPNYGSNDGALFFNFNNQDFRDFRPQLQALAITLDITDAKYGFENVTYEDLFWYGLNPNHSNKSENPHVNTINSYTKGGFYIVHDHESMTYIRCGNHKDRPSQSDNLHLDIWYKGINVFRDNGSYMYNSEISLRNFFMGTISHNCVMLDDFDQMLKGPRFLWFYWSQCRKAELYEYADHFEFVGTISAFRYLNRNIQHKRKVIKFKGKSNWVIEDEIKGTKNYIMNQIWHFNPLVERSLSIKAQDQSGNILVKNELDGWHSAYYGIKEKTTFWTFSSETRKIITEIKIEG